MRKLLIVLVVIALAFGYAVTRGMRAGAGRIGQDRKEYVECVYLRWGGLHHKLIDMTGKVIDPNTNSYCPFLENSATTVSGWAYGPEETPVSPRR